jgi:hypothetical protein
VAGQTSKTHPKNHGHTVQIPRKENGEKNFATWPWNWSTSLKIGANRTVGAIKNTILKKVIFVFSDARGGLLIKTNPGALRP